MSMRGLFLLAVVLCVYLVPTSGRACTLTASDLDSLKLSRSGLSDQAQVDALPQDRQTLLCGTRMKWNHIASGNWTDEDMAHVSVYYLSPSEGAAFVKVLDAYMVAKLKNMSDSE